jgi:hypothetical protein
VAVSAAAVAGANVMLIVHVAFEASEAPQVVADFAKSAAFVPVIVLEEMDTAAFVLLVKVTVFAALVLLTP